MPSTRTTMCSASPATRRTATPAIPTSPAARRCRARSAPEPLKGKRDFDKAKQLIKEAGYKGEKIVIISATDQPIVHSQTLLTAEMLRKLGLNVELAGGRLGHADHAPHVEGAGRKGRLVDLPHLAGRSRSHDPGDQFRDARHGPEGVVRLAGRREDRGAARRVVRDDRCRQRRRRRPTRCRRARSSSCPYVPTAQFILPTAYRTNLTGVIIAPITLLWNVEKR